MQAKWIKVDLQVCSDKGKPEMVLGLHRHYKTQMLGFLHITGDAYLLNFARILSCYKSSCKTGEDYKLFPAV